MNTRELLCAKDIRASWGKKEILHGISLAVAAGEVLSLIGPNGSGKSTLLTVLAGLKEQDSGSILLDGEPLPRRHGKEFARRAAFVPQNEQFVWPFTVEEAVLTGRYPHTSWTGNYRETDRLAAEKALSVMELRGLRTRTVTSLSGGEFQRMRLARALAQESGILILDEPVSGLDIRFQYMFMEYIRSFAASGAAVIVTIHDLNFASLFSHRIAVLSEGLIAAQGTAEEVFRADVLSAVYGLPLRIFNHPVLHRLQAEPDYTAYKDLYKD